jgi:hypothetical protein
MMRPFLSRFAATPHGSRKKPLNTESKSAGPKGVSDDGFERLDDDTSHLWLRLMGLQHCADASDLRETTPGDASKGDQESLDRRERSGGFDSQDIKQS